MAWHIELVGGLGDGGTAEVTHPIPEIHVPAPDSVLIYRHSGLTRAGVLIYRYVGEHPA